MKQGTKPSDIKPIQARPWVMPLAMQIAAERAKSQPRLIAISSNVSNFRHMGE